ncbi:succinate-semialdehyde dehydrogenase [Vibrio maritimus]|uniref:Succinate-semialdehyde dehydrogenase n=1 Tax=Vibrio maritimus TaxID=990268 RepID=A0A090RUF9_9VIBR|nr:succinate-semialdehyde dehydrogenase [Vibrio maritimus]
MSIRTLNPYTNRIEKTFDALEDRQVIEKIANADVAFRAWRRTSHSERAALLSKVADFLEARAEQYATLMTTEMGKLHSQGMALEIPLCAEICRYYAEHGERFLSPESIDEVATGRAEIQNLP